MIIVQLTGGLGNQMFQYALGRVLSHKNSDKLTLDLSNYNPFFNTMDTIRSFELDIFNLKYEEASRSELVRLSDSNPIINFINSIFKTKINPFPVGFTPEIAHKFQRQVLQLKGSIYLRGYWQTEKYFKDYRDLIRNEFKFTKKTGSRNKVVLADIKRTNSVSVHVRRGDYVNIKTTKAFHGTCGPNYYLRSASYIEKNIINPIYYVFSDDPEWCKNNLKLSGRTVIIDHNKGNDGWMDMWLMSNCKHNIIANSSFSWWGAWLNENSSKIVITPKIWFKDKTVDTEDLVPSSWIKL